MGILVVGLSQNVDISRSELSLTTSCTGGWGSFRRSGSASPGTLQHLMQGAIGAMQCNASYRRTVQYRKKVVIVL